MIALLLGLAAATDAFDPTTPAATFTGRETWTQVEDVQLWSTVERWRDPGAGLFTSEAFNQGIAWADTDTTPWIRTCFASATPPSSTFLLHVGLNAAIAEGTPILLVHGAGDNGSRGFVTLATKLDRLRRPVFALTFAHPHGDMFQQAEIVADAIAVIRERTGAAQVDLVGHSKGGVAAVLYASHTADQDWGRPDYEQHGTPYRGDVRKLVLAATPLGGVDTSFRWSSTNFLALDPVTTVGPSSWDRYYPLGTGNLLVFDDLSDGDLMPAGLDVFPGQRQLLARQDAPLPGSQAWLGTYALQQDWYTTYEGGLGFVSRSPGIDDAVAAGGDLVAKLTTAGVDPDVAVYLLAGTNPLMPNADAALAELFGDAMTRQDYADLVADIDDHGVPLAADADELDGLDSGAVVLGEVTGISDGLVFLDSATKAAAVDARGATIVETYTADLSHLDLLYASPITGQLLIDAGNENPGTDAWMRAWGRRYTEADTLGWFERVLADPASPGDSGDTGTPGDAPTDPTPTHDYQRPCGGCDQGTVAPGAGLLLAALFTRRRRR